MYYCSVENFISLFMFSQLLSCSNVFTRNFLFNIWFLQKWTLCPLHTIWEHKFITKELFTVKVIEVSIQPFRSSNRIKIQTSMLRTIMSKNWNFSTLNISHSQFEIPNAFFLFVILKYVYVVFPFFWLHNTQIIILLLVMSLDKVQL